MDYMKRRYSSSDDSDDAIPPTPAAKSTPYFPVNRQRQQLSSSSSSPNKNSLQTVRLSGVINRPNADDDSSSDEEVPHPSASLNFWKANVKREQSDSSSDEEEKNQVTHETSQMSSLRGDRQTHAMSSSGSEDSGPEHSAHQSKINRDQNSESSEDSDDNSVVKPPAVFMKMEKPSTSEESEESDGGYAEVSGVASTNYSQNNAETSSDESEEEPARNVAIAKFDPSGGQKRKKQEPETPTSSDESEEEQQRKESTLLAHRSQSTLSSESEQEEVSFPSPKPVEDTSSDQSENEADQQKTIRGTTERDYEQSQRDQIAERQQSSSEDETEEQNVKPHLQTQHQMRRSNFKLSRDTISDEEQTSKIVLASSNDRPTSEQSSDDLFEDDSNDNNTQQLQKFPIQNTAMHSEKSSDENSSDDEEVLEKLGSLGSEVTTTHISPDEQEAYEVKFNPGSNSKIAGNNLNQRSDSVSQTPHQHVVPVSRKRGRSLMEETFKASAPLQIQQAVLTVDDIGSDDEIWLFQCPNSMDVGALKKQIIDLSTESDIQIQDGQTFKRFSVTPEHNTNMFINCALPNQNGSKFQISSLPVKGKVVIQEHVHVPKLRLPKMSEKGPVPFPDGLKVRHPLLGIEFEKHIAQANKALKERKIYDKDKMSKKKKRNIGYEFLGLSSKDSSINNPSDPVLHSFSPFNSKKKKDCYENDSASLKSNRGDKGKDGIRKIRRDEVSNVQKSNYKNLQNSPFNGSSLNGTSVERGRKSKKDGEEVDSNCEQGMGIKGHHTEHGTPHCSKERKKSKGELRGSEKAEKTLKILQNSKISDETPVSSRRFGDLPLTKKSRRSKEDGKILDPSEIKSEIFLDNGSYQLNCSQSLVSKQGKRKNQDHVQDAFNTPSKRKKYGL